MAKYILYAYVDGSDLHDIAEYLSAGFNAFINSRQWVSPKVIFVNQIRNEQNDSPEGSLPLWELGLNLDLPEKGQRNPDWYDDIEALVQILVELHKETGRDFVIGLGDSETGFGEDYLFIDGVNKNTEDLRGFLE